MLIPAWHAKQSSLIAIQHCGVGVGSLLPDLPPLFPFDGGDGNGISCGGLGYVDKTHLPSLNM